MQEPTTNWEGSGSDCCVSLSSHPVLLGCAPHVRGWLEMTDPQPALFEIEEEEP